MRLIDADSLKVHVAASVLDGNQEHKDRASALLRAIDSMPTAYDVDKVEDQRGTLDMKVKQFMKVTDNDTFLRFVEAGRVISEVMSYKFKGSLYANDIELMKRDIKRVRARAEGTIEITLI